MAHGNHSKIINVMHPICCGLDVHKKKVSACVLSVDDNGKEKADLREFRTFTKDLIELRDWLLTFDCPVVALESTGIYWRPVHNILEDHFEVVLVNPKHFRNLPGRKTDLEDCQWLAGLLKHGLLRGSFIPPQEVREWRDLTRLRKRHTQTRADYKKRVQKLFESANIKIDSVATDLFGVTGMNLMGLLLEKDVAKITPEDVEQCSRGKLQKKSDELYQAIRGFFTDHHRFLLRSMLRTIQALEEEIAVLNHSLELLLEPYGELLDRLDEIPGVDQVAARAILAEIGPSLDSFETREALCAWSGVCPGNNESGGKRKSGRSRVKKHHLKSLLVECSWAAIRTKGSYYKDKYYRLKARRGAKKAIIAIAHRMLKAIYHIIKDGASFRELGEGYLNQKRKDLAFFRLHKLAVQLGYQVTPVTPVTSLQCT